MHKFYGPIPPLFKHTSLAQVDFLSDLFCHGVFSLRIDSIKECLRSGDSITRLGKGVKIKYKKVVPL